MRRVVFSTRRRGTAIVMMKMAGNPKSTRYDWHTGWEGYAAGPPAAPALMTSFLSRQRRSASRDREHKRSKGRDRQEDHSRDSRHGERSHHSSKKMRK